MLSATDADVVKAYVAAGLGIATVPEIAYAPRLDTKLAAIDARHLFPPNITYIWVHRHHYLRTYAAEFIRMLSPTWTRAAVDRFMRSTEPAGSELAIDPHRAEENVGGSIRTMTQQAADLALRPA